MAFSFLAQLNNSAYILEFIIKSVKLSDITAYTSLNKHLINKQQAHI